MKFSVILFYCLLCFASTAQIPALIPFHNNNRWGYVDTSFSIQIPLAFSRAFPFVNEKALAVLNDTLWQIDTAGQFLYYYRGQVVDAAYGTVVVKKEGRASLIALNGTLLLKDNYLDILPLDLDRYLVVRTDSTAGIINTRGDTLDVFQPIDRKLYSTPVAENKKPECTMCRVDDFYAGLAIIFGEKLYGYCDTTGAVIIPFAFDVAEPFLFGLAYVELPPDSPGYSQKRKTGYIDRMGRLYYQD